VIAYLAFSYSKTAEQNRVWVGMAKETAHQLGTPLSSLMAWVEYIKQDPRFTTSDHNLAEELDKDVQKLQIITERFSSIGSVPVLKEENVENLIRKTVNYLQARLPNRVHIAIEAISANITAKLSPPLFEWVIENLCKNAVDAMDGAGNINIKILRGSDYKVFIDIGDSGKGIPKSKIRQVFSPGFTTKKRGWGLGLTRVKRIIENYHDGKIFVKSSEPEKGTVFRIVLSTQI
jgi:signal transduction histidine kinase